MTQGVKGTNLANKIRGGHANQKHDTRKRGALGPTRSKEQGQKKEEKWHQIHES